MGRARRRVGRPLPEPRSPHRRRRSDAARSRGREAGVALVAEDARLAIIAIGAAAGGRLLLTPDAGAKVDLSFLCPDLLNAMRSTGARTVINRTQASRNSGSTPAPQTDAPLATPAWTVGARISSGSSRRATHAVDGGQRGRCLKPQASESRSFPAARTPCSAHDRTHDGLEVSAASSVGSGSQRSFALQTRPRAARASGWSRAVTCGRYPAPVPRRTRTAASPTRTLMALRGFAPASRLGR